MDGRRPSGDRAEPIRASCRSALEIVSECKLAQLESELAAARQVAERARADAAEGADLELTRELATAGPFRSAFALREANLTERIACWRPSASGCWAAWWSGPGARRPPRAASRPTPTWPASSPSCAPNRDAAELEGGGRGPG